MIDHQAAIAKPACRAAEVVYPVRRELRELSEGHGSRVLTDVHVRRTKHKQRKRACRGHGGLQQHPSCTHLAGAQQPQNDSPQRRNRARSPACHGSSCTHPAIRSNKETAVLHSPQLQRQLTWKSIQTNLTRRMPKLPTILHIDFPLQSHHGSHSIGYTCSSPGNA